MTHLTRQRISRCLTKSACATRVKYDSSRNSVFVLGRLFLFFFLVGFAQVSMTLMKLKGGQQRRLQSGSAVLRLQAKRPGAQMAFMTIMGWRHIQWKSNLSSYRKKKKKKVYECGFAPNTRQSESTMGTGRLPKSLLEQVPAARAGSPLPLGH